MTQSPGGGTKAASGCRSPWLATAGALLLAACADDAGGPAADTDDVGSGFDGSSHGTTGSTSPTDSDPTSGTASPTDPSDPTAAGTSYDTLGEGDLRGTLTFVYFAPDPLNEDAIVGMAGAWRDQALGFDDVYDFFGVYGLGINFPAPPQDEDTLESNDIPADFEWGAPDDWLLAGNAMKLRLPDVAPQACLLYRGGSPTIELPPDDTPVPNYPIYAATYSSNQPEGCAPDPGWWIPETEYDIVLYGGDLFETNSLVGQVHTPAEITVDTPDFSEFQLPVDVTQDLEIAWSGASLPGNRVVIRVFDVFGRMFTIHAADDGSYTIPAAELATLSVGPGTIIVSRENVEEVPFTDGMIDVITRFERWGYVDFF